MSPTVGVWARQMFNALMSIFIVIKGAYSRLVVELLHPVVNTSHTLEIPSLLGSILLLVIKIWWISSNEKSTNLQITLLIVDSQAWLNG